MEVPCRPPSPSPCDSGCTPAGSAATAPPTWPGNSGCARARCVASVRPSAATARPPWSPPTRASPGPCWARRFSPPAAFGQVPVAAVRQAIRAQFGRWGRPAAVRVDNGTPWGNWNDLPTPLALWLVGLGVRVHWNDPGCPQQNPKVERSQGTGKRWAEPGRCGGVAELQANLDEADRIQREEYPTPAGPSRWALFAGLRHSG